MNLSTPLTIVRQRLLNAAKAVMEFDHSEDRWRPGLIDMAHYAKHCGSPGCVLGHYAARQDLQDEFILLGSKLQSTIGSWKYWDSLSFDNKIVQDHFHLTQTEAYNLFAQTGCLGAQTADQVNRYIRRFIDRKYPQWGKHVDSQGSSTV